MTARTKIGMGAALLMSAVMASVTAVAPASAGTPQAPLPAAPAIATDGLSMSTAAASCWEIKQNNPASPDGIYWLQTPALVAPEQFYCDQTTDGGGWVLIARGRENWSYYSEGKGTTAEVRSTINGTGAFATKQLSAEVVNGLLNGNRMSTLSADGIRMRRATNTAGTAWQDMRMVLQADKMTGFNWGWGAQVPVAAYNFGGGLTGAGGTTYGFGYGAANYFTTSIQDSRTGYSAGMGFLVPGTTDPNSYIWSKTNGATPSLPFTQMFLRPKLRTADLAYPAGSNTALPASLIQSLASDRILDSTWGVTGLANGDQGEKSIEVAAFAQVGNVMYVGGNFTHAINKGDAATKQPQAYLAAFDVNTGNWISTFRPVLNNQVKALYALPNGQLLVGGQFTQVNGVTQTGLVALDPKTGAISTTYKVGAVLANTAAINVRSFSQQGDWLYIAGRFSHLWGGPRTIDKKVYAGNAGRINIKTGEPDYKWNPRLNGGAWSINASAKGDRVYIGGVFTKSGATYADNAVALSSTGVTANPAPDLQVIPWALEHAHPLHYQQAVMEYGDKIYLAGAQHQFFVYDRNTMRKISGGISYAGGDFQAIAEHDGVIYSGNHGLHFYYDGGTTYGAVNGGTGPWTDAYKFSFTGAWNGTTGKFLPEFDPMLKGRRDNGTWAITFDSNGTMWMGGDFTTAVGANGKTQWVGAFMRFPERDDVAPGTPTGAKKSGTTLSWKAAVDDRAGKVSYEVLINGRVRYTTTATSVQVATQPGDIVVVRTKDALNNRSASTAPIA